MFCNLTKPAWFRYQDLRQHTTCRRSCLKGVAVRDPSPEAPELLSRILLLSPTLCPSLFEHQGLDSLANDQHGLSRRLPSLAPLCPALLVQSALLLASNSLLCSAPLLTSHLVMREQLPSPEALRCSRRPNWHDCCRGVLPPHSSARPFHSKCPPCALVSAASRGGWASAPSGLFPSRSPVLILSAARCPTGLATFEL